MATKAKRKRDGSSAGAAAVRREFARLAQQMAAGDGDSGGESRRARGLRKLTEIVGVDGGAVLNKLVTFSPEVTRDIVDHAYGSVLAEGKLDERTRALVVVAALAAIGNAQPQLQVHIGSAVNCGCSREEILETLRIVALYAGFPAALNGLAAARAAMEGADGKSDQKSGRSRRKRRGTRGSL